MYKFYKNENVWWVLKFYFASYTNTFLLQNSKCTVASVYVFALSELTELKTQKKNQTKCLFFTGLYINTFPNKGGDEFTPILQTQILWNHLHENTSKQ